MMFLSLFTLASLPALSFAARTVTACVQTCGGLSTSCSTQYGTEPVAIVSTVTTTNTVPTTITISATETTYLLTTVTPSPITTTTTQTSTIVTTTTLSDVTSDITVTDTFTETDTATITTTNTETDIATVSTTTTSTSTVSTPAGFLPISDTINGYPGSKIKRGYLAQHGSAHGLFAGNTTRGVMPNFHPSKVNCEIMSVVSETRRLWFTSTLDSTTTVTQTSTSTEVDPTYTTLPPVDVTATITTTVTSTSTQGPATDLTTTTLSTTITTTTTSTVSATITVTNTDTMTFTSTSTYQAVCATNNIIASYTNQGETRSIADVFNNGATESSTGSVVSADSAYDCCVTCSGTAGCTGSVYLGSGLCVLLAYSSTGSGQCVQNQNPAFWTYDEGNGGSFEVSNGLCGYAYEGGPDT